VTWDKVKELQVDNLLISDYDCKGYEYAVEFLKSLNCIIVRDDKNGVIYGSNKYISNIRYQYDWPMYSRINNLAGCLKDDIYYNGHIIPWRKDKEIRQEKCIELDWYVSIDYMGNVFPCSYMRYEIPEHRELMLGNINETSLYEIRKTDKWKELRSRLNSPNDMSKVPDACKHCNKSRKQNTQEGILYEDIFF
jgi:radical SAM protein with 4Fe4S-binding SPASM domain